MNNMEWKDFAKNVADYVGVEEETITEETDLYSDLMVDSLGLFSLGIYLTGIYKLEVPLSSVAVISKLGDLFRLMNEEGVPTHE